MITDLGDRLILRPVTTRGPKANTFIDLPLSEHLLQGIAAYLGTIAAKDEPDGSPVANHYRQLFVSAAKARAVEGELEVDDNALVSIIDEPGANVQAWLWIPGDEIHWPDCHCNDDPKNLLSSGA